MAEKAYCEKCNAKVDMVRMKKVKMANGRPALKGNCARCGTGVYKILPVANEKQMRTPPMDTKNSKRNDMPRYWIYAPGSNACFWDECQEKSVMVIGEWESGLRMLPDMSEKAIVRECEKKGEDKAVARMFVDYIRTMQPGDKVFVKDGQSILRGIGEVKSDFFRKEVISYDGYPYCRKVKWEKAGRWTLPDGMKRFPQQTLTELKDPDRIQALLALVEKPSQGDRGKNKSGKTGEWLERIQKEKNVIFYGPPGTGKTYNLLQLQKQYDGRSEIVTFHQSYSYEDFVEGIKPVLDGGEDGKLHYELKKGIFRTLCERADQDREHDYALFIDEINRGNVAAIFGELISLIETDKRDGAMEVTLPYSRESFTVPANLYIIGTMNTADRSVEALDTALRRRFAFVAMPPDLALVPEKTVDGVNLRKLLETVNGRIEALLDADHCIGHSFLMKCESLDDIRRAFTDKILPLLKEYFYGDPGKVGMVLGERFVKAKPVAKLANGSWNDEGMEPRTSYEFADPMALDAGAFASIYA